MIAEILNAFIFRLRFGLRLDHAELFAGHGFADANFRPGRLPYASVVGPLNLEVEPDRDPPRNSFIFAQSPGYLAGADGLAGQPVPAPGRLHLTFDGDADISLDLDFGADAGQPLDDDIARRVARLATTALEIAVDGGAALIDGAPVTDPDRLAELRRGSLRWDRRRQRFLMVSGRRQVIDEAARLDGAGQSSVAIRPGPLDLSADLGFDADSLAAPGRISRHRISQPTAVAVDVRLDLWAGGQQSLADMLERWAALTPTRGQLLVCPGVLNEDAAPGDTRLRLLPGGWPAAPWTLALMDGAAAFDNRATGVAATLAGDAAVVDDTMRLAGTGTASVRVWEAPPLPPVDRPDHPAPYGYALTVEVATEGAPADGEVVRIVTLTDGAADAISLTARIRTRAATLEAVMEARADRDGGNFAPRDFLIDPARLEAGVVFHLALDAARGNLALYADGAPLPLDDETAPPPLVAGLPIGNDDMQLVFGAAAGIGRPIRLRRAELIGRPLGPMDPRISSTTAGASRWRIRDPVGLTRTAFGGETAQPFNAVVIGIDGDTLILDRPVPRRFGRASAVVFKRSLFFAQRQWRRRDDLMNRLFRLSAEYRVSAFLEERLPSTTAPIVETPEVELRDMARMLAERQAAALGLDPPPPPIAPRSDRPGIAVEIVDAPTVLRRPAETET